MCLNLNHFGHHIQLLIKILIILGKISTTLVEISTISVEIQNILSEMSIILVRILTISINILNIFIPRRELRKQCPRESSWQSFHFNIYVFEKQKIGFQKYPSISHFLKVKKTFIVRIGGWVDGWVVIKRVFRFSFFF